MAGDSRKPLSKKTRFEVFKRDNFTCQYCGQCPPAVVLHVDHILAVVSGGSDDQANLVTSCIDCNLGKGAGDLKQAPPPLANQMAEAQERSEQMSAYNSFLMEARAREQAIIDDLGRFWFNKIYRKQDQYVFADQRVQSVRTFLKYLTPAEILEAIDIAHSRRQAYGEADTQTWKYFCGVCWRKIERRGQ